MIISIPPAFGYVCEEFKDATKPDDKNPKTVIITPLRVTMSQESCKVSFGCNMWKACANEDCSYCQAGMVRNYD